MYPPLQDRYAQFWHHFKNRVDTNIEQFQTFQKDFNMYLVYEKVPKIDSICKILKDVTKYDSKKRHLNEEIKTS